MQHPIPHVDIIDEQTDFTVDPKRVIALTLATLAYEEVACHEVAIHFVSEQRICELHDLFFDDPSPTDCISLPMDEETDEIYRHLGEIFVCPKVAFDYVKEHGGNIEHEIVLYIVHGLLHLIGYDDIEESETAEMRAAESRHLSHLEEKGLCLLSQ